jgi:stage V sporulation protein R
VDLRGDRSLTLRHMQHNRVPLEEDTAKEVMRHLHRLWGFDTYLESVQDGKVTATYQCDDATLKADLFDAESAEED